MSMLMVGIVPVLVVMRQRLVPVCVCMPFAEVEPRADSHEHCSDQKLDSQVVAEDEYSKSCPNKRSDGKICACPRRP
jgi:hypothetical protein